MNTLVVQGKIRFKDDENRHLCDWKWIQFQHKIFSWPTTGISLLQLLVALSLVIRWFCREVLDAHKVTNFADDLELHNKEIHHDQDQANWDKRWISKKLPYLQPFDKVLLRVCSRYANTSSCKKKRCGWKCNSDNGNLQHFGSRIIISYGTYIYIPSIEQCWGKIPRSYRIPGSV